MSVKDLIDAIASGSATETQAAFSQVMAEKISARLDDMRVEVAQGMFQEGYSSKKKMKEEDECNDKDEKEMDEELNLEDYSLEEIEEFMMSEDFEQLDELSKNTLGSYVKKATTSRNKMWKDMPKNKTSGYPEKTMSKVMNRNDSIRKAQDKLAKEEYDLDISEDFE